MKGKMKTSTVITLSATAVSIVGLITFLISTDRDITPLLIALPTVVAALGALFNTNVLNNKVEVVKQQTNGTLSKITADNLAKQDEISQLRTLLTPAQAAKVEPKEVPNSESV